MPKKDEREALEEIKSHSNFKNIPWIILTTSQARKILRTHIEIEIFSEENPAMWVVKFVP